MKKVKKSISISEDLAEWLGQHEEVNLSGLVDKWLKNYQKAYDGSMEA
jgi:hypothetical protein